jgi:hypothetical protein
MIIRDGTGDDPRFAGVELAAYVSGGRLILVVNQGDVCMARLVLTPFDLGAGTTGLLQAIARHSLPVTVTLGEHRPTGESRDVEADPAQS